MIKTSKKCKVCKTILSQPKKWEGRLAKQIYGSRFYTPASEYSLKKIAADYKGHFTYEGLLNHCKKHQSISEQDYNDRQLRQTAAQAEKALLKKAIKSTEVWDTVITEAMEKLQNGQLPISTNHLLQAARDKSNYEFKATDQQMQMMDMVFHFASGEAPASLDESESNREVIDVEATVSGDPEQDFERRAAQSRSFYQSLAGDAPTPGSD